MSHYITAQDEDGNELGAVGHISRAAGNPLNQVAYLALGCMEDAYAGCSGNGCTLEFTRLQIADAIEVIASKSFEGMTRDRNAADDLVDILRAGGANVVEPDRDWSVMQETLFFARCLQHMFRSGEATIQIQFA